MTEQAQAVVDRYMGRLKTELAALPRARRQEILEEIREHIYQSLGRNGSAGEAEVRTLLDQLGDPSEIAAEARQRFGVEGERFGTRATVTLILISLGGIAYGIGWIAGVILLWTSSLWTTGEKVIGTLALPGGLGVVLMLGFFFLTGGFKGEPVAFLVFGLAFAISLAVPIWLGVRAQRRSPVSG